MKRNKIVKRQQPYVYLNAKVKVHDLVRIVKNKLDRYRVLMCIQSLMKKGKGEKAIKIIRDVVYNLYKEESERRSVQGGLYYIIDGIKRLEHVLYLMPIKKKGRVRYKKVKALNQQKSISKAIQLLIKHSQQKVFETQQSYVKVLTQEFKELYTGISKLYKKNDEAYQELVTQRYRRKYRIKPAIYLAKFRKKQENYRSDRQPQKKLKIKRGRKRKKKIRHLKSLKYQMQLRKLTGDKRGSKKRKKESQVTGIEEDKEVTLPKKARKFLLWGEINLTLVKNKACSQRIILYNIVNQIKNDREALKNLITSLTKVNGEKSYKFVIKQGTGYLELIARSLKVLVLKQSLKKRKERQIYTANKVYIDHWFVNGRRGQEVEEKITKQVAAYWFIYKLKEARNALYDYYSLIRYKNHKEGKIKLWSSVGLKKTRKEEMYRKKRRNLYKRKRKGVKFPDTLKYTKEHLTSLKVLKKQQTRYNKKGLKIGEGLLSQLKEVRSEIQKITIKANGQCF